MSHLVLRPGEHPDTYHLEIDGHDLSRHAHSVTISIRPGGPDEFGYVADAVITVPIDRRSEIDLPEALVSLVKESVDTEAGA